MNSEKEESVDPLATVKEDVAKLPADKSSKDYSFTVDSASLSLGYPFLSSFNSPPKSSQQRAIEYVMAALQIQPPSKPQERVVEVTVDGWHVTAHLEIREEQQ